MRSRVSPIKRGADVNDPIHHFAFEAIGTQWWIGLYSAVTDSALVALRQTISQRIDEYDKAYSRFRPSSLVSAMAAKTGTYALPKDAPKLLLFYRQLYDATAGKVTPLIGGTLSDAGYDATYSLQPKSELRPVPPWDDVLAYDSDANTLKMQQSIILDFGAAGKGYLLDIVGKLLQANGVNAYVIDAGGDMLAHNAPESFTIGLENPTNTEQVIGTTRLQNGALCASAGSRRAWAGMHHIFDPDALSSTSDVLATWVWAESAMMADGLATALFFTNPAELSEQFTFEFARFMPDSSVQHSPNTNLKLYSA